MNRRDALKALMALPATASVSVAQLRPNDVIVVEYDGHLTMQQVEMLKGYIEPVWPEHKCVVLGSGLKLKIAREA
jgi:hypothetical protein